ncbi:MAG: metal-dependent hydrolase [Candidatus Lokiarchaeia archaeon]|nr:metal-dependent hydrolase [Candidatus Lokiarchaeia archaeon]
MDIFTHAVVGALLYILFLKDVTFDYISIAIFFAVLPDLDIFLIPLRRIFKSKYLDHRGGSHSYVMGIMISAFLSIFYSIFRSKSFFIIWIIGVVFYGLHVSMDLLTTTKIPYLYPLSKKEHCFYVEKAGSFFTMVNSIFLLLLLGLMFILSADLSLIRFVLNLYTAFFIIYYFYRIVSKVWFSSNLKDNQKYFPRISPFSFVIYDQNITENNILLKLEKKNHFLKPKEISNIDFTLNTEEMILFEKSMELLKKNYYYAKWTLFPIIIRNDEVFSVRFYFLETMRGKSAFYIQYHFGMLTHKLISFRRGSGPIQSQYG